MNTMQTELRKPHHVNYVVSDLDRSIWYYRDVLGLKLIQDVMRENLPSYDALMGVKNVKLRVALFELPQSSLLLELFQFFTPLVAPQAVGFQYVGSSHLAYEVDDVDKLFEKFTENGCRVIAAPVDIVREGKLIARCMYGLDPDGIVLELLSPNELGRKEMPGFSDDDSVRESLAH